MDHSLQTPPLASSSSTLQVVGNDLAQWWSLLHRDQRQRFGFKAEAHRILALRFETVLRERKVLALEVRAEGIWCEGNPFTPDREESRHLAHHLRSLGIRTITLLPSLHSLEFVRFLEQCAGETPGSGAPDRVKELCPGQLELTMGTPDTTPLVPLDASETSDPQAPAIAPEDRLPGRSSELMEHLLTCAIQDEPLVRASLVHQLLEELQETSKATIIKLATQSVDLGRRLVKKRAHSTFATFLEEFHSLALQSHSLEGMEWAAKVAEQSERADLIVYALGQLSPNDNAEDMVGRLLRFQSWNTVMRGSRVALKRGLIRNGSGDGLRQQFIQQLAQCASIDPDSLPTMLEDPNPDMASLALETVPLVPEEVAVRALPRALDHLSVDVRLDAVKRATFLSVKGQVEVLPPALQDTAKRVRKLAAVALGACCIASATRPLQKLAQSPGFHDKEADEQIAIYSALAKSGRSEALYIVEQRLIPPSSGFWEKALKRFQRLDNDPVRAALARCLAQIDTSQCWEILRRGARCGNAEVEQICQQAIEPPE